MHETIPRAWHDRDAIEVLRVRIGRQGGTIHVPKSAPQRAKDRLAAAMEESAAHSSLERRFGSGVRLLLVIRPRRKRCTVIHAPTLAYLADFPMRWIAEEPVQPMTRRQWKRLAILMDRRRRLLMPGDRDKQAEAIKEAIALARSRAEAPLGRSTKPEDRE